MASFLSNLLSMFSSGNAPAAKTGPEIAPQEHAGCLIYPDPIKEGSQYRLAGRIEKQVGETVLVRTFIRADMFTSMDDVVESTFRKARQIIDQNGASLFADGAPERAT
ncbi:HlyU family transcriptional regulator [Neorhizobium sp. NPDC001467]|uniref:HlyU family transcriptional regulator n=1 Tax=Neorhizobium sp. NPDC001467 TaxID=3390595 RepID=UPI003D037774